ncbi:protein SENSITIVE TO PROTON RHIZOTOXICITY 2-like [Trifolium pratense]|uniref:protein SENSITIVE TO PROTON RHIZOTOXICITY 2-like n=1 Tax=Trifolium pratense TaxID=57577 RepID=UPI001E690E1B|nr:protein SENSITIVE TO PROTON RHIZOTOXICITY 2-like [Trifolium pratense]
MNMHNHTEIIQQTNNTNIPLHNLNELSTKMDSIQRYISQSINTNTLLPKHHLDTLSDQISTTIRQVIINATALLATYPATTMVKPTTCYKTYDENDALLTTCPATITDPPTNCYRIRGENNSCINDAVANSTIDSDVVELDAVELLANHFHFCEICGKGFTRNANLRMHMRAHGDKFKTPESLRCGRETRLSATRFSCPFESCKRNRLHKKFTPLKSVLCLRNHFKRSHCPKTHTCDRCRKKSFALVSDLKSHVKQCKGESTWKCSCGTTFSRKEKLFGHMERFEGHSPAVVEVGDESMAAGECVGEMLTKETDCLDGLPDGFFDDLDKFWV